MRIHMKAGDNQVNHHVNIEVDIDISKEDMKFLKAEAGETWLRICHLIEMSCSEGAKGVQVL
uniref:Uncharacterized protein n=1 Tax=viral metagenome TaxID=1070528 RepID=A0A6M3MCN2_9ZZZZ